MNSLLKAIWVASIVLMVIQALTAYNDLPDRMAVHFNSEGTPDGWSDKDSFIVGWLALFLFLNIWPPLVKYIIVKTPAKWINTPRKDYWLADDRRKEKLSNIVMTTMTGLFTVITSFSCWLFNIPMILMSKGPQRSRSG
jgi:uncharacterized membrane protein